MIFMKHRHQMLFKQVNFSPVIIKINMQSKIVLSFLVAVCKAAETSYEWDGPTVTRGDKTLTASGSTKWTTTGTGADRSMT